MFISSDVVRVRVIEMENVLVAHKMFYRMLRYAEYVENYSKYDGCEGDMNICRELELGQKFVFYLVHTLWSSNRYSRLGQGDVFEWHQHIIRSYVLL